MNRVLSCWILALMFLAAQTGSAQQTSSSNDPNSRLAELSIEDLVNLEITSVSKKQTHLSQSPAAVAVLTGEDVRRLGATSVAEALRAVPGMQVSKVSPNTWAVTARGFNDEYSNKLLVLVDGRSAYTPTYGGVYWNVLDMVLEDLARIEVIRGPGATLWGANAVNGVINIITKSASETQGGLVSVLAGTEDQPTVSARYGGKLATNLYYRVYTKYLNRNGTEVVDFDAGAGWNVLRGGLRLDWEPQNGNNVTFLADYYGGNYEEQIGKTSLYPADYRVFTVDAPTSGGNVLARWRHTISDESEFTLQAYYDTYRRGHPFGGGVLVAAPDTFDPDQNVALGSRDTADVDFQHRFMLGNRQEVVWGVGYRHTWDTFDVRDSELVLNPSDSQEDLVSGFLQDEIKLVPEHLWLTLGSKIEHNDFTGWEVQPTAKLLWHPVERQTFWTSVARAVRTPTRLERSARANLFSSTLPDSTPVLAALISNPDADSEEVLAYEVGWRIEPARHLSFDLAGFYNDYNLLTTVPSDPYFEASPAPPHLLAPYSFVNAITGHSWGAELLARWQPADRWRITAAYSWFDTDLEKTVGQTTPEHQVSVRSGLDLGSGWELNTAAYYVDRIQSTSQNLTGPVEIPAYVRLDVGVTWRPGDNLEFSFWAQNLLDDGHPEFASYKTPYLSEIARSFYGKITWRF